MMLAQHRFKNVVLPVLLGVLVTAGSLAAFSTSDAQDADRNDERLTIVWTSGDPEVAHRMVLMYGGAAKTAGWFDEVRLIVWGPSSRLLAADKDLQATVKQMQDDGVIVQACIVCADSYGVTQDLRDLGLEVKGMGKPLSDLVKDHGVHILTF